jgi:hypothetical protein
VLMRELGVDPDTWQYWCPATIQLIAKNKPEK